MPLIHQPTRVCTDCMVSQGRQCHCRGMASPMVGLRRSESAASPVDRLMQVLLPTNSGLMAVARKLTDLAAPRR